MLTISIVLCHTSKPQIAVLFDCIIKSVVEVIYLIDNSADDRYRTLEKQSDKIRYIHNKNLGYGTSHSVALREAIGIGSDFHLILNTDIRFELSILHEAISYLQKHPEVAYLLPKVLSPTVKCSIFVNYSSRPLI